MDAMDFAYSGNSDYLISLNNPIYFLDRGGMYVVDKDGNIIKFDIDKDGQLKFHTPVDAFTKKVIESMNQTEASRKVLIAVRDDKEIKVAYQQSTSEINQYYIKNQNMDLIGTVMPKEEFELISAFLRGDINEEEFASKKRSLAYKKYSVCGNCFKRIFYKDPQVFSEQAVLIDLEEINGMVDPEKEFLMTVTEESFHSLQTFIEIPRGGVQSQEQYLNLEHEK